MSNNQINQSVIEVVKAYVSGNKVSVEELPRLVTVVAYVVPMNGSSRNRPPL